jgi:hypothetical protein
MDAGFNQGGGNKYREVTVVTGFTRSVIAENIIVLFFTWKFWIQENLQ